MCESVITRTMSNQSLNALEKRAAFSLASVFAFRMLGLFMLMPVLAIYGQSLEHVSPMWIGLAIGSRHPAPTTTRRPEPAAVR